MSEKQADFKSIAENFPDPETLQTKQEEAALTVCFQVTAFSDEPVKDKLFITIYLNTFLADNPRH